MNEVLKTIDALPDGRTVFYAPKSRDEPFANMTTDDLKKLAALVPKWTRVEDGLPEKDGDYLCIMQRSDLSHNKVIAWMPLPQPYTEEQDEQR